MVNGLMLTNWKTIYYRIVQNFDGETLTFLTLSS